MEKILSSEMANEQIEKLAERKNTIATEIEEKRSVFESADIETREAVLEEVEKLEQEADEIDEQVEELEEQRNKFAAQEERMSLVKNVETVKVEERTAEMKSVNVEQEERKFVEKLRDAIVKHDETEARALLTEIVDGTAPVATLLQGKVEAVWERLSILNEVSISTYKGILAVPYEVSATPAVFHKEGTEAVTEETLEIGKILLVPTTIKKLLRASDEVIALTPQEFVDYLFDEVIYQVNLLLENSVVSRNATDGVIGITASALTETVQTALNFNAINAGIAELVEVGEPVVIMNRKTFYANVMGLVDLQQRPIFQIATDNQGRARHYINGARVLFTNGLKAYDDAAAGEAWAIVGDLKAYKLNLPESRMPLVLFDRYTEADADMNRIIGRIIAAGAVVRPKALAKLTKAA